MAGYMKKLALALALSATPATAERVKEPIVAIYEGESASDAVANGCIDHGWTIKGRTDYELICVDMRPNPQPAATFSFVKSNGQVVIQATTRIVVWPGRPPTFGPALFMARDIAAMLDKIGAKRRP